MRESRKNIIFDMVINGVELTTKNLLSYGLNATYITILLHKNIIKRKERGSYSFIGLNELFNYGKELQKIDKDKARLCFFKCFVFDNKHYDACFELILYNVLDENYKIVLSYLDSLLTCGIPQYKIDANLFLYLLNMVIEVPEKYKEYLTKLGYEDIEILSSDTRYEEIIEHNRFRRCILDGKIDEASELILEYFKDDLNVQDLITKTLFSKKQKTLDEQIRELIQNKRYEEVYEMMLEKKEEYSDELLILEAYLDIKRTNIIPNKKINYANSWQEALIGANYDLTLSLSKKVESCTITILLGDLYELVYKIRNDRALKEFNVSDEDRIDKIVNNLFNILWSYIKQDQKSEVLELVHNYLKVINKMEYEFLVSDLVMLCFIEKELVVELYEIIKLISKEEYKIDVNSFVDEFYVAIAEEKIEVAKIYLNIIRKISDATSFISLDVLEDALNEVLLKEKEKFDELRDLVWSKHNELSEGNEIVVIKNLDEEIFGQILNIVKEFNDMEAFYIKDDGETQLVLRYMPSYEISNIKEYSENMLNLAIQSYYENNIDACIEYYHKLLQLETVYHYVYSGLGLAYLKKGDINSAILYLTISTHMAKMNGDEKCDYTDLIRELKLETGKLDDRYGIYYFEQFDTIIRETNLDIFEACKFYGISELDLQTILLVYASDAFKDEDVTRGNAYINEVLKRDINSNFIKKLLDEVQSRGNDTTKSLSLDK